MEENQKKEKLKSKQVVEEHSERDLVFFLLFQRQEIYFEDLRRNGLWLEMDILHIFLIYQSQHQMKFFFLFFFFSFSFFFFVLSKQKIVKLTFLFLLLLSFPFLSFHLRFFFVFSSFFLLLS